MTPLDPTTLAALRAAKEKATATPWTVAQTVTGTVYVVPELGGDRDSICEVTLPSASAEMAFDNDKQVRKANANYIVLLANSAAALLDAAEENVRLRKALGTLADTDNLEDNGLDSMNRMAKFARTALEKP